MEIEESALAGTSIRCCNCECSSSDGCTSSGDWIRTVKRKHDEFERCDSFTIPGLEPEYPSVAKVNVENELDVLREMVSNQQQVIQDLCLELEEERNASSSAANETMSMILRLQKEKAEIQMEARQFMRFTEEKMSHDQEEIAALEDLLYKREQLIQSLTCEVQAYKHRIRSYGFSDEEIDGDKSLVLARTQCTVEIYDDQLESPRYDYPPLICGMNETPLEGQSEDANVENYAFDDVPLSREEQLKSLEDRIDQMEVNPSNNHIDSHSPKVSLHSRKLSVESSSTDVKKMDYVSQTDASEFGVDGNDRVYTLDSVHDHDGVTAARETGKLSRVNSEDADFQKLNMRLQALEADRESMRQALFSMRADTAQLILLKEIAQHLSKDTSSSSEKEIVVKKPTVSKTFSVVSIFKWIGSFMFWRNRTTKYLFGLSATSVGLLMLLEKKTGKTPLRCFTKTICAAKSPSFQPGPKPTAQ